MEGGGRRRCRRAAREYRRIARPSAAGRDSRREDKNETQSCYGRPMGEPAIVDGRRRRAHRRADDLERRVDARAAGRVRRAARRQRVGQVDAAEGAARRAGAVGGTRRGARAARRATPARRSAICRSAARSRRRRACAASTSCAWASTATAGGCRWRCRGGAARRARGGARARRGGRSSWSARAATPSARSASCSGGEQQRLLIAQALVRRPELLLLDEPLDSLDLPNQASVAALVAEICRAEGVATLLVAHDVNPLLAYLDRVVYLAARPRRRGPGRGGRHEQTLTRLYGAAGGGAARLRRAPGRGRPARAAGAPPRPPRARARGARATRMTLTPRTRRSSWDVAHDVSQVLEYHFMLNALLAGSVVAVMAGAGRLGDGAAPRGVRRAHAVDDGLPRRVGGGARGRAGGLGLLPVLRRRGAAIGRRGRRRGASPGASSRRASAPCRRSRWPPAFCS